MKINLLQRRRRRGGAVAQTLVSDSFTRANSAVTLGSADTGQAWTANRGTWGISSNAAYNPVIDASTLDTATVDAGSANVTVSVTLATYAAAQRVCGRQTDAANGLLVDVQDTAINLYRVTADSPNLLGTAAIVAASGCTIALVMSGNSISVRFNGSQVIGPITESQGSSVTKHGLGNGGSTIATFDNFLITTP